MFQNYEKREVGNFMGDYFNKMMFNQQYISQKYYRTIQPILQSQIQDQKVCEAVKAIHDLCEAVKDMDESHQQKAFIACLTEIAREFEWK